MKPQKRNPGISYINPEIPEFEVPTVKGERYEVRVPDTLDLAERAALLVHVMTESADLDNNAEIYWRANFGWKPPSMYHDMNDWCEYKYYAPSLLLRQACGADKNLEVEWHRMANLCQMQGPDGLFYIPLSNRPWATDAGGDASLDEANGQVGHILGTSMLGRQIQTTGVYYRLTGDSRWFDMGRRAVDGVSNVLIDKGDYTHTTKLVFAPGENAQETAERLPPRATAGSIWLGSGLLGFYCMTGYEPARELARKIAKFYQQGHGGFVGPSGELLHTHGTQSFTPDQYVHFHTNTLLRVFLLEAGLVLDDDELIELARLGYEDGKKHGETLMGYFAENYHPVTGAACNSCEFCEVAEMIYLAFRMGTAGVADTMDDADRWLRNMWAEGQITDTGWVEEFSAQHGIPTDKPYSTADRVAERYNGSVGGWIHPSDWQGVPELSAEACCIGNASIALYKIWRDMVQYDADTRRLKVHLLMNRASPWADVSSHVPYKGLVEVRMKTDCEIALRMPEWTSPESCTCSVNGQQVNAKPEGRYLVLTAGRGDKVDLRFPIAEREETLSFAGTSDDDGSAIRNEYKVVVRGNEIVDINPAGKRRPIFQRPHYRENETRWKTVERFVSDSVVNTY